MFGILKLFFAVGDRRRKNQWITVQRRTLMLLRLGQIIASSCTYRYWWSSSSLLVQVLFELLGLLAHLLRVCFILKMQLSDNLILRSWRHQLKLEFICAPRQQRQLPCRRRLWLQRMMRHALVHSAALRWTPSYFIRQLQRRQIFCRFWSLDSWKRNFITFNHWFFLHYLQSLYRGWLCAARSLIWLCWSSQFGFDYLHVGMFGFLTCFFLLLFGLDVVVFYYFLDTTCFWKRSQQSGWVRGHRLFQDSSRRNQILVT